MVMHEMHTEHKGFSLQRVKPYVQLLVDCIAPEERGEWRTCP
jgi:hypothetical protein